MWSESARSIVYKISGGYRGCQLLPASIAKTRREIARGQLNGLVAGGFSPRLRVCLIIIGPVGA